MKNSLSFIMVLALLTSSLSSSLLAQNTDRRVLFVTSNQSTYGDLSKKTSNHFGEIVLAYDEFAKAGYQIDFISPKGGAIPIGYINDKNPIQKKYLEMPSFMNVLKNTKRPEDVKAKDYIAIYFPGGGAAMYGVPENEAIQLLAKEIYGNNGVISAVCHGTAGIAHLTNDSGTSLYQGKKVSGFPDQFEKVNAPYYQTFPFSIEKKIRENGGDFVYSKKGWDGFYVTDGRLVTGQDPTSSAEVAKKVISINNK